MSQLALLHITDSLKVGGTERQVFEIVKRLNSKKYTVFVVTFDKSGPLYDDYRTLGLPLSEIRLGRSFLSFKTIIQILKLAHFMSVNKIKIVQTHGYYSNIPGIVAAKIARVPVVVASCRDLGFFISARQKALHHWVLQGANKIVVNSSSVKDALISQGFPHPEKIARIYNGVDTERFSPAYKKVMPQNSLRLTSDEHTVGFVGNLRRMKDHKTFIEAAYIVCQEFKNVKFVLVGNGPLKGEIEERCLELGIFNRVVFTGTQRNVEKIIQTFDVSVLSTHGEGFPNSVLESMATGIPIVATSVGGTNELIEDGVDGFLVPPKNPQILAEKIVYLLKNKESARRFGQKGREKVERYFSYDRMIRELEDLYDSFNLCE